MAVVPAEGWEPAVRFLDADGALVREPPSGEPITDATDPCPACDAFDWELATRVRCRACGTQLALSGTWEPAAAARARVPRAGPAGNASAPVAPPSDSPPPADSRARGGPRGRHTSMWFAELTENALRDAPGPVYAVAGETARVGGVGGLPGEVRRVTLVTGEIAVETSFESFGGRARSKLADSGPLPPMPRRLSPAARGIWLDARRRERLAAAALASESTIEIAVDGRPRTFTLLTAGEEWVAAGDGITVRGRGPVPAELQRQH